MNFYHKLTNDMQKEHRTFSTKITDFSYPDISLLNLMLTSKTIKYKNINNNKSQQGK